MKLRLLVIGALLFGGLFVVLAAGYTVARASSHAPQRAAKAGERVATPSSLRDGVVVSYVAGKSITIQSTQGQTVTYTLDGSLVVVPAARAGDLGPGKKVTILTPNAASGTAAIGIILHPLPGEDGVPVPMFDPLAGIAG